MSQRHAAPLIAAKLSVPPLRAGAVPRPRLHVPMPGRSGTRLTVVVAPAGWGKTTLLSQWAQDSGEAPSVAWVSLDETDDDPIRFWTYVFTALQGIDGLTATPLGALSTPGLSPIDLALPMLLNELAAIAGDNVLVLDDYHLLEDREIHEGMEFFLSYLPAGLRVVIATRADPPLPLARMRARGELTELRAADLGFSVEEAATLLSTVGNTSLDRLAAGLLWERTEGWAAGLQLAALSIRGAALPEAAAMAIHGDDRHILDYLSAEVLDRLATDQRDLLVRTSVLERLSGPLCDDVLDRRGSAAILAQLDRADLFVVALDQRREWYRCHRLFREALRKELTNESESARVQLRAAEWFLDRDHVAEAVELRLSAGDDGGAAELLRSKVPWFLDRGALATHLQLGQRLPAGTVQSDPALCVSLAWAAGLSGQFSRMSRWLDTAEKSITDDSSPLPGWHTLRGPFAMLRAIDITSTGTTGADLAAAITTAECAVDLETDPEVLGYMATRAILGALLSFAGRSEEAVPLLEDAWDHARMLSLPPLLGLQAAAILSLVLSETGRVDKLRRLFAEVAPAVEAAEEQWGTATAPGISRLRTVEGRLAHSDGDLARARILLQRGVEVARGYGQPSELVTALTSLAEVELDDRDRAAARAALVEAREVVTNEPVLPMFVDRLVAVERRAGHGAVQAARRSGVLIEDLTDREQSVLRALATDATQREIGSSLYLSINTVKGYTKALYRKLGVTTRQDAVQLGRDLGLI